MLIKNAVVFSFEKSFHHTAEELHEALERKPFTECSPMQRESMGWVPPLGKNSQSYTHAANGFILLTMARQERLLPASVVREELDERVIEIQDRENRKVGSKEKKELRERIEDELLPRAFTRTQKLSAWIDLKNGWVVINTPATNKAESLITLLRKTIGSLPVTRFDTSNVSANLTSWLDGSSPLPESLEIGDECELKGSGDNTGVAAFKKHELGTDDVKTNLESGKSVSKLALIWDNKISFVLGEDMGLKKIKYMGLMAESIDDQDPQSHEERMDIEFALVTGEISILLKLLTQSLDLIGETFEHGLGVPPSQAVFAEPDQEISPFHDHYDKAKKIFSSGDEVSTLHLSSCLGIGFSDASSLAQELLNAGDIEQVGQALFKKSSS